MTDYSTTCPWAFLDEMVEGGSFPKELFDKLKEAQEEEDEDSRDLINDLEEDRDKWEAVAGISEDIIKKLQEENKKLKEELSVESTCLQIVKDENEVNKKNMIKFMEEKRKLDTICETLVKEAEKNKMEIKSYQFYLFVADPKCRCAPGKEDVDEFTDDQKLREYLYEEIGYEEEEEVEEEEKEDYKSFGVMNVYEDGEDDLGFFDTKKQAIQFLNEYRSKNTGLKGKLIVFVSATYNPEYDNEGTVSIVKEYSLP